MRLDFDLMQAEQRIARLIFVLPFRTAYSGLFLFFFSLFLHVCLNVYIGEFSLLMIYRCDS